MFFALDAETGEIRWSYDTAADGEPAQFHGDPLITDDLVVTGSDRSTLNYTYAFDRFTGAVRWKNKESVFETDLFAFESSVIGRRWNGDLLALSLADGELLWTVRPTGYEYRFHEDDSPVLSGGVVLFGGVDGFVYAVDAGSGIVKWGRDVGTRITAEPATDGRHVFVGAADRNIYQLQVADGSTVAQIRCDDRPTGRPVLAGGAVVVLVGSSTLTAFEPGLEEIRWEQKATGRWSSPQPLKWKNMVLVGTGSGNVRGFDTSDGHEALSLEVDGVVRGLGADGDILFVGTLGGLLVAFKQR